MQSRTAEVLEAALLYAQWGWRVFPLHSPQDDPDRPCTCVRPGCENIGKHPLFKGWQQHATTDATQVSEWWDRWPEANIGIATGEGSGIWVLDIDGRDGPKSLQEREDKHGMLPVTAEQITGSGGRHKL